MDANAQPKKTPKKPTERQALFGVMIAVWLVGIATGLLGAGLGSLWDEHRGHQTSGGSMIVMAGLVLLVCLLSFREVPKSFRQSWFQRFAHDREAVSPVIAVILMVAITVVLAAVVFVMVSDISDNAGTSAPNIGFQPDYPAQAITVYHVAKPGMEWDDFTVRGCTRPEGNETVDPGDRLTECSGDVSVIHEPSRTLVYTAKF